jgi:hypothetical protein
VSLMKTKRTSGGVAVVGERAKSAAAQAVPIGKRAGTTAAQGVQGAREWAAPRLEDAAEAVTTTVAPKVSSALRSTAQQVRPAKSGKTGVRRLLNWRWLLGIGAVLAAGGATAAITMRRRYASATAEAKDATEASEDGGTPQASDAAVHSEVNGQVTTSAKDK